jgi:hypothetical protein
MSIQEIVNRAIENGWLLEDGDRLISIRIYDDYVNANKKPILITLDNNNRSVFLFCHYTFNDLLADEDFVKALFSEKKVCNSCGDSYRRVKKNSGCCGDFTKAIKAYEYHCKELSTIFSQEEKIKYITENWA